MFDRNMMFNFNDIQRLKAKNDVFFHIVNANFFAIQIKNIIDQFVSLIKNERLNILINYEKNDCYLTNSKIRFLIVDF